MAVALSNDSESSDNHSSFAGHHRRPRYWPVVMSIFLVAVSIVAGVIAFIVMHGRDQQSASQSLFVVPEPYDAVRAERYLRTICDFGPRPSGSMAMQKQQKWLTEFFTESGATVELQSFQARHPETGAMVELNNLIARWYPDRPKRFLLCAHYDTRPFPDRDSENPTGRFVGANDGASGVAALMEFANHQARLPKDVGFDIVLFDGEELVYRERRDSYFLGSTHFAESYKASPPKIKYQAGILLDMIGDRELKIYYERNSWNYARDICKSVFETASLLKVEAFVPRIRHEVRDDHLPLNEIARIPTIDLIDFDYPRPGIGAPQYWHTTKDVPENCSGHSIASVVFVVHQWMMRQ